MAEATVRSQVSQDLILSEDENSSTFSIAQTRVTSANMADKKKQAVTAKSKFSRASAKMEDLILLENKITAEIIAKFS